MGAAMLAAARPARARAGEAGLVTGEKTLEDLLAQAHEGRWRERAIGARVGAVGMALRRTPYVDGTLELYDDREVCSVNLKGLDCVTFFESALAVARMLKRGGRTPESLVAEVTYTRYRDGRVTDYASRLHYMSDWFFDNQAKRVVRVITGDLPGAAPFTKRVGFMSAHPEAYRQLRANPEMVAKIARVEADINARATQYLPKEKVAAARGYLKTGDIVGITTTIDGLDCSHSGLCYRDDGGAVRLLHASTTKKAVVLDEDLASYLAGVPTQTGIMVARPVEVGPAVP
jgi:N-acetylmuramoyl-L-alanine amidase-like protein